MADVGTGAFILTAVSAAGAALAAVASWFQIRATARSAEADIFLRLSEDYGSEQMRQAISVLAQFWGQGSLSFKSAAEAYAEEEKLNPANAKVIRANCRIVTAYFGAAARLYDEKFISRRLLKVIISRPGLNLYYDVCEPINIFRHPGGHTARYGDVLRSVVKKYSDGSYDR